MTVDPDDFGNPDSDVREAALEADALGVRGRAYITSLQALQRACSREMDRIQVGDPEGKDVSRAVDRFWEARVAYRCARL